MTDAWEVEWADEEKVDAKMSEWGDDGERPDAAMECMQSRYFKEDVDAFGFAAQRSKSAEYRWAGVTPVCKESYGDGYPGWYWEPCGDQIGFDNGERVA